MLPIVYPSGVNWFNEEQALKLARDLNATGNNAIAIAPESFIAQCHTTSDSVLIVNLYECMVTANNASCEKMFVNSLMNYKRRILVNYDSIYSNWYSHQFSVSPGLITDVFDIGMVIQSNEITRGVPYFWLPESFTQDERLSIEPWTANRCFPWSIVGHITPDRATFTSAVHRIFGTSGFVYLPPLKPYSQQSGLDERSLHKVLKQTKLYIWSSHHNFPYHEGLRALHAVRAGAVPAKIDPMNAGYFSDIPWVYSDLQSLSNAVNDVGTHQLYQNAYDFLMKRETLGVHVEEALKFKG